MKLFARASRYFLLIFLMMFSCRKIYDPPVIEGNNHFLAVNGSIYTGNAVTSMIALSRSLNLYDSVTDRPEFNAVVNIQTSGGDIYGLIDSFGTGIYQSAALNLDSTLQYRLNIVTSDGNKFQSDFVTVKQAPPVDSLTWELIGDPDPRTNKQAINIFVNAHDPNNATRYYRWDYTQTYKHFATYRTYLGVANDMIYPLPLGVSYYTCWSTVPSQSFALGSSVTLSQDVISHIPVAHILQNDSKLDVGCSFLVRQYPLTEEGYNYWLTVQKNSQSLGGLFDLQPSQIRGNIQAVTNPNDPVLGYISAGTIQEQRLFIDNHALGWRSNPEINCPIRIIPTDPNNTLIWSDSDTSQSIYYFNSGSPPTINVTYKNCLDCRYQGGTSTKPPFWQ
ncbi:MAG TPA: DUF4249 domain-containing protein [Puia sp.]|nr:DUF4249 domain-containing protein [Puia sp.]